MKTFSIQQDFSLSYRYPVVFTEAVFDLNNRVLADQLVASDFGEAKVLVVVDDQVLLAHPSLSIDIPAYMRAHAIELVADILSAAGGEAVKTDDKLIHTIYRQVANAAIDRHSYILAIGGGAVLDAVGYAAATAHRGIRLIRCPTTVLAQNDAGIGVKNGINYLGRKNFLGTFVPPYAVINDLSFLSSLQERDKRSGIAEAVKIALIKDRLFFDALYADRYALARFESAAMQRMILRCAELHLQHIRTSGDPFELGSARPLDFGHWSAHKFEGMSDYRIRHGEAVAMGIALDVEYCAGMKMISQEQKALIHDLLLALGFELVCPEMARLDVPSSLEEFREHLGGRLCITLLECIGKGREVGEIDAEVMRASLAELISKYTC